MSKILFVNLGEKGGCVYYANSILTHLKTNAEIWLHPYSEGGENINHTPIPISKLRLRLFLIISPLVLIWYFIYLSICIIVKKYQKVVVFGPHIMDFMILLPFRLFRKRAYYVVHDGIMHTGDSSVIYQIGIKWSMKLATNLIFLSDYTRSLVKNKLNIRKNSIVIPHGIVRYGSKILAKKRLGSPIRYLMIGRITYYKGIDIIFDFLSSGYEFDGILTIAGKFSSEIEVPDNIKNDGRVVIDNRWLSGIDIDNYVKNADVLLMPYHEATQSGIAAMALGYNIPVIATDVGALKEQLGESAYYMEKANAESLYRIIHTQINIDSWNYKLDISCKLSSQLEWSNLSQKLVQYLNEN